MSLRAEIHKKLGAFSLDILLETQGGVLGLLGASGCGKNEADRAGKTTSFFFHF